MRLEPMVFVVDDEEAIRDALRLLGRAVGLKVATYASAQAFLEDYTPGQPGCLVLDLLMPGMSGLELQAELAARRIDLPVIFITGHGDSDEPELRRALETSRLEVIEKPFRTEVLISRIRSMLVKTVLTGDINSTALPT